MKQLLVDVIPFDVSPHMIQEAMEKNNGKLTVSGILQRANALNQNKRRYPKPILVREATKYMDNLVKQRRALGELDHPDSSVVNLGNVSHNITEMWWNGDDLCGKVEILSTPSGNILKELFRSGIRLGISSRGLGSVRELRGEEVEVQEDFELIAFDFVSNPSTQGAFLSPLHEGVNTQMEHEINKQKKINSLITEILSEIR